ncbi:hypothetical protein MRX96_054969 [Rhipicephalus microplus]
MGAIFCRSACVFTGAYGVAWIITSKQGTQTGSTRAFLVMSRCARSRQGGTRNDTDKSMKRKYPRILDRANALTTINTMQQDADESAAQDPRPDSDSGRVASRQLLRARRKTRSGVTFAGGVPRGRSFDPLRVAAQARATDTPNHS